MRSGWGHGGIGENTNRSFVEEIEHYKTVRIGRSKVMVVQTKTSARKNDASTCFAYIRNTLMAFSLVASCCLSFFTRKFLRCFLK